MTFERNVMSRLKASGVAVDSFALHEQSVNRFGELTGPRTRRSIWIGGIVTALMAVLMLLSAVPDVLRLPDALLVFERLGYPPYLLRFLGTAKILAVAAVLVPVPRWIKEWAFAGLTIDVAGALYSHLSIGDPPAAWAPAVIALALVSGSYFAYRLREAPPCLAKSAREERASLV
jgi:DoxX-like protein